MFRSIQAECFKVVHRPYFWITTILCALFSVGVIFCLYLIKTEASGVNPVNMPFAVASLLFGLPAGIYLVGSFIRFYSECSILLEVWYRLMK